MKLSEKVVIPYVPCYRPLFEQQLSKRAEDLHTALAIREGFVSCKSGDMALALFLSLSPRFVSGASNVQRSMFALAVSLVTVFNSQETFNNPCPMLRLEA